MNWLEQLKDIVVGAVLLAIVTAIVSVLIPVILGIGYLLDHSMVAVVSCLGAMVFVVVCGIIGKFARRP